MCTIIFRGDSSDMGWSKQRSQRQHLPASQSLESNAVGPQMCVYNYKPTPLARAFKISTQASFIERLIFSLLSLQWTLGFSHSESEPFKNYQFLIFLWVLWMQAPLAFKARYFGGYPSGESLTQQGARYEVQILCLLREKLGVVSSLLIVSCQLGVEFMERLFLSLCYPIQCGFFLFDVQESLS